MTKKNRINFYENLNQQKNNAKNSNKNNNSKTKLQQNNREKQQSFDKKISRKCNMIAQKQQINIITYT